MNNVISVKDIIEEAVVKSKKLKEAIIRAKWKEIAGTLFFKSSPLYIKEGVLHVLVESSILLQHMYMNKNNYIEKINIILKDNYIEDIVFKVGNIPLEEYFSDNQEVESEESDVYLSPDEYKDIEKNLENIEDIQIRKKLFSLKIQSLKREKILMKSGYKYCSECGILHKNSRNLCTICENKHHMKREEVLLKLFEENPYTSFEDAVKLVRDISRDEYDKSKEKKLDKIYKRAEFYMKDGSIEEAHSKLVDYFKLETGEREKERLSDKAYNLIELIREKYRGG